MGNSVTPSNVGSMHCVSCIFYFRFKYSCMNLLSDTLCCGKNKNDLVGIQSAKFGVDVCVVILIIVSPDIHVLLFDFVEEFKMLGAYTKYFCQHKRL